MRIIAHYDHWEMHIKVIRQLRALNCLVVSVCFQLSSSYSVSPFYLSSKSLNDNWKCTKFVMRIWVVNDPKRINKGLSKMLTF